MYEIVTNQSDNYDEDFARIRGSLVCVHDDEFERDSDVIMREYIAEFESTGNVPKMSQLESIVTSINWSISYDMAEFLLENNEGYIEAFEDYVCDYKAGYPDDYHVDLDDIRYEFISEQCSELFNDLYWYHTHEIRDNLRQILIESFVEYVDDIPDNPMLHHMLDYLESHAVYANNAQIIMFDNLYEWQYGTDCLIPTDAGHRCSHLILRKDGVTRERLRLSCKEVAG